MFFLFALFEIAIPVIEKRIQSRIYQRFRLHDYNKLWDTIHYLLKELEQE